MQPPPRVSTEEVLGTSSAVTDATPLSAGAADASATPASATATAGEAEVEAEEPMLSEQTTGMANKNKTLSGNVPRPKQQNEHNRWLDKSPLPPRMKFDPPSTTAPSTANGSTVTATAGREEQKNQEQNSPSNSAAVSSKPAAPAAKPSGPSFKATGRFTASDKFEGRCVGYAYKLGAQGLGYYRDPVQFKDMPAPEKPKIEWAQTDKTVSLLVQVRC